MWLGRIDGEAENLGVSAFDWQAITKYVRSKRFEILPPTTLAMTQMTPSP